jgi:hypothetical protein
VLALSAASCGGQAEGRGQHRNRPRDGRLIWSIARIAQPALLDQGSFRRYQGIRLSLAIWQFARKLPFPETRPLNIKESHVFKENGRGIFIINREYRHNEVLYYLAKRLGVTLPTARKCTRDIQIRYPRLRHTVTSTPPAATEIVRRLDPSITGLPRHAILADTVTPTGEHGDFR